MEDLDLADALESLPNEVATPQKKDGTKPAALFFENAAQYARETIIERGISKETYQALNITFNMDTNSPHFGYMEVPHYEDKSIRRKFIPDMTGERFKNSSGTDEKKGGYPFYGIDTLPESCKDVILVEGIYDYMALYEMGYRNVVCALMSDIQEKPCYPLRGKTVFILFDCDYAGYKGSRKAVEHFREMEANPIILQLPKAFGKDPHLAWKYNRPHFSKWLAEKIAEYDSVDASYIKDSFFTNSEALLYYPVGFSPSLDTLLGGGYKAGIHVIGGQPGTGKSMLVNRLAASIAARGGRVLNCTYELSKLQIWSRTASQFDERNWAEIEMDTTIIAPTTRAKLELLGTRVRVVAGWNANQIERAISSFDVVIVDYIQRMPSSKPEVKQGVSDNIQRLSNLARDFNKIIFVISSLPRAGYKAEGDMGVFKESGDIEYVCQSAMVIKRAANDPILTCNLLKNTRGGVGTFLLKSDLGHCMFEDADLLPDGPESL